MRESYFSAGEANLSAILRDKTGETKNYNKPVSEGILIFA
jgi:hypothetical protein